MLCVVACSGSLTISMVLHMVRSMVVQNLQIPMYAQIEVSVVCAGLRLQPPESPEPSDAARRSWRWLIFYHRITMTRHVLLLAILLLRAAAAAFEVPFPPSSAEIRSAVISSPAAVSASSPPIVTQNLLLGSGTTAEVISCIPPPASKPSVGESFLSALFGVGATPSNEDKKSNEKPVIAFLHGSFHASWCWTEKFMPHFASLGYPCVAFSLQGTGGTPTVEEGARKVKIVSHVRDLDAFLRGLSDDDASCLGLGLGVNPPVVVVGHSFGGLTIMKWLEKVYGYGEDADADAKGKEANERTINLAGVSLMCSVPPSGNGKMTGRFLMRSFRDSWKITAGFVLKRAITDKAICRDLFFGGVDDDNGVSDEDIERYQSYFDRDTVATIDLSDLAKKLPSMKADKQTGAAPFADELPPSLVIAASDDFIVDAEGSMETARYFGLDAAVVTESPHDVMLGNKWKNAADTLLEWVQGL